MSLRTSVINSQNLIKTAKRVLNKLQKSDLHTSLQKLTHEKQTSPLKGLLDNSLNYDNIKNSAVQQWATLPYLQGTNLRKQGVFYQEECKEPSDVSIIFFPGENSAFPGMGKSLLKFPMVNDLYELSNYILGYNICKISTKGPKTELEQTKNVQLGVMIASLAALEKLKEERPKAIENCVATAGFGVGEITALVFAGALQFERALKLVEIRGKAMQLASEAYSGGMAMIFYTPETKLGKALALSKDWAKQKGEPVPECTISNYIYPHCKIIAGSTEALDYLEKNAKELKILKIKRLNTNGAFYSSLMTPAISPFAKALEKSEISDPIINVYSGVDAKRYKDAAHIKKQLPKQLAKPIKWEQLLHVLYERDPGKHFPRTFECGPGSFLRNTLKEVNAKAWDSCFSIEA